MFLLVYKTFFFFFFWNWDLKTVFLNPCSFARCQSLGGGLQNSWSGKGLPVPERLTPSDVEAKLCSNSTEKEEYLQSIQVAAQFSVSLQHCSGVCSMGGTQPDSHEINNDSATPPGQFCAELYLKRWRRLQNRSKISLTCAFKTIYGCRETSLYEIYNCPA
jgi:hypothetical protein